jgi:hypothetical protein
MDIRKIIQRRIRSSEGGVAFTGDLNAVVSANVGQRPEPAAEDPATEESEEKESE